MKLNYQVLKQRKNLITQKNISDFFKKNSKIIKLENIIKRKKEQIFQELTRIKNHYNFWNEKINPTTDILEPKEYILQKKKIGPSTHPFIDDD